MKRRSFRHPRPATGPLTGLVTGLVTGLLVAPALLAGCGALGATDGGSAKTQVAASFYPLQFVAEGVAGEHADVSNLTSPGVEPHDLDLSVGQTADIAEADVAIYLAGFQPAVDEALDQNGPDAVLEAGKAVGLDEDPHFWLDPLLMAEAADAFAEELADVDPDHADDFEANAAQLRDELTTLDQEYTAGLADCRLDTVVVSHDAFGYLERYGLTFRAIAGLSPDAEPSPGHIAELQDLIRRDGITTVFSETLASPAMAETLAGDLGLETAVLDPVEGLGDNAAGADYLSLMRDNLEALRAANGCR